MRIVYDYPPFKRALTAMWPQFAGRCVCVVDERGILGGCGFSTVKQGCTSAFILGLRPAWASREIYANIMRLPHAMGAETIFATCGNNLRSQSVCRQMRGKDIGGGNFEFTSEGLLKRAREIENAQ